MWDIPEWLSILLLLGAALLLLYLGARYRHRKLRSGSDESAARLLEPRPAPPSSPLARPVRYPVVLVHGWAGFDQLALPGGPQAYFRGVRGALEAHGHAVYIARVAPLSGIQRRAEQLAAQLAAYDVPKVNIVAHSMGGLDARYAISQLGIAGRVASLCTIGTPHHGTPLLAGRIHAGSMLVFRQLKSLLAADFEGLSDIAEAPMEAFNELVLDVPAVDYFCYLGAVSREHVHRLLLPSYTYLRKRCGDNDGLVPAASQQWGECLGTIDADHWSQIGWFGEFDAPGFYSDLARLLAERGY